MNAQDDNGIVSGNWSGDYTGGTSPTKWVGSVAMLKDYEDNNGTPVKFGQCWVFSGITTTGIFRKIIHTLFSPFLVKQI